MKRRPRITKLKFVSKNRQPISTKLSPGKVQYTKMILLRAILDCVDRYQQNNQVDQHLCCQRRTNEEQYNQQEKCIRLGIKIFPVFHLDKPGEKADRSDRQQNRNNDFGLREQSLDTTWKFLPIPSKTQC